jgi:hypothetical protein
MYCGFIKDKNDRAGVNMEVNGEPEVPTNFSNLGLSTLKRANEISIDGTFSTCPTPFKQILFNQAKQAGERGVPAVFALLSNKVQKFVGLLYFNMRESSVVHIRTPNILGQSVFLLG